MYDFEARVKKRNKMQNVYTKDLTFQEPRRRAVSAAWENDASRKIDMIAKSATSFYNDKSMHRQQRNLKTGAYTE